MKKRTFNIISIIVFLIAMVMLTAISVPLIKHCNEPDKFKAYIDSLGSWGIVMMFFIQIAQIIVALIPGEVVEFVAGTLYGWFGGMVFCLVGIALGQALIFKAVKFFGKDFVEKAAGSKVMTKFSFLHNETKLKSVLFFLFFIPGVPKDLLTYFVPLTKIKLREFILITTIARIPSVISSTIAGSAFTDQNYILLIGVYIGIFVFSAIGALIYKRFSSKHNLSENKISQDSESEKESEDAETLNV